MWGGPDPNLPKCVGCRHLDLEHEICTYTGDPCRTVTMEHCGHMKEMRKELAWKKKQMADLLRDLFTICDDPCQRTIEKKREKWKEWLRKEAMGGAIPDRG